MKVFTQIVCLITGVLIIYSLLHKDYISANFYAILTLYNGLSLQISEFEEKIIKLIENKK